jgi:hypothetical protein
VSDERYLLRIRSTNSWTRSSTEFSRCGFSLPEYWTLVSVLFFGEPDLLTYPWGHLFPSLLVLLVICLAKDIVPPIFDAARIIVPVGALISGLVVDMDPNVGRGRNQDVRCYSCNGT